MIAFKTLARAFAVAAVACTTTVTMAVAPAGAAAVKPNAGATVHLRTVPLTIVNKSGRGKMFVFVYGTYNGTSYYVTHPAGTVSTFPDSTSYQAYGLGFGNKKTVTIRVPEMMNTRVYVSYGRKMKFTSAGGVPSTPSGWSRSDPTGAKNPNFRTLFDWFEYSWGPQPAPVPPQLPANATYLNGNQTQVDMFGLPMLFTFVGVDANNNPVTLRGGFKSAKARQRIFAAMKKAGAPWKRLVIGGGNKTPLRVISPYNGISMGVFPSDQFDGYIDSVWSKYTGAGAAKTIVAKTTGPSQSFTGAVSGTDLVFTRQGAGGTVTFAKPTTMQAYQAWAPTVSPSGDADLQTGAGELMTMVQATLMRTTMLARNTISACPATTAYYTNAPVNMYAKTIHRYAYQRLAYGFGFDDVCNQGSDQQVFQPSRVILTIQPLNK